MKSFGKCEVCGGDIIETDFSYCCENQGKMREEKHDIIWKNALERMGGCMLDERDAVALLKGEEIKVQLRSRKTGRYYYARANYDREDKRVKVNF